MYNQFALRTGNRARWLAELSAVLDEAQDLLTQLAAERIDRADADLLRTRIVDVRNQLRSLDAVGFLPHRAIEGPCPLQPDWRPGGIRPLPAARPRPRTVP